MVISIKESRPRKPRPKPRHKVIETTPDGRIIAMECRHCGSILPMDVFKEHLAEGHGK